MDALAPLLLTWLIGFPAIVVACAWLGAHRRERALASVGGVPDLTPQPQLRPRPRVSPMRHRSRRPCAAERPLARDL
jgi:hypothetical protein